MRRLALFCGGFAAGIFLAQYLLPGGWLLSGGLGCLALGFGALLLPECWRKRAILCLVGAALALGWNWLYVRQVSEPMEALADTQQALTMTLTEYPAETRFGAKVTVRAEGLPGKLTYYGDPSLLQLINIQTFVNEQISKFMLGERSFDTWDAYVDEVNSLGLDKLKAIHESSYARVLAAQQG